MVLVLRYDMIISSWSIVCTDVVLELHYDMIMMQERAAKLKVILKIYRYWTCLGFTKNIIAWLKEPIKMFNISYIFFIFFFFYFIFDLLQIF